MYKKIKSVLISHVGIPSNKIGSWNLMLTNLIEADNTIFDYIISPKEDFTIDNIQNITINKTTNYHNKVVIKLTKDRFLSKKKYWNPIHKLLKKEEKLLINVIDDFGILNAIHYYATKENLRDKIFINFYYHGYYFDLNMIKINNSFALDKLVLLTKVSYYNFLNNSLELPFEVAILPNGIKSNFTKISSKEKSVLKNKLGFKEDKKHFLWLSQDRPKKGLNIILNAWKIIAEKRNDIELLIIGTNRSEKIKNVKFLGRINNNELPNYYQISDYYLFPTLWHEGHPLSLTEALKSGLKCIVSDIDPLKEIMHNGDLGYLVDKPNMVESWVNSINFVLDNENNFNKNNIDLNDLYNFETWKNGFSKILKQSKQSFN